MKDSFEAQKRYFQFQIEQGKKKPGLHKNRIEDCRRYLQALEEAGSPAAFRNYVQRTGNMLSSAKADAGDRYANRLFLYEKLGSRLKAGAERIRLGAIDEARTHQDLVRMLEEAEEKARPLGQRENRMIMAASRVMEAVFHLATDPAGSEARKRSAGNLKEYWKWLKEEDPEFSFDRLVSHLPFRNRMIFTESQLAVLKKVFQEAMDGRHG